MIFSASPAAALRPFIRYYYGNTARPGAAAVWQPVPARSPQIIEFMFGTPYEVHRLERGTVELAKGAMLVGAKTHRHVDLLLSGAVDAFTIGFQPGGLAAIFGVPVADLTDADFDAGSALGRPLDEFHERLAAQRDFAARVRVADAFLCARRPDRHAPSPLARAATLLQMRAGAMSMAHVAGLTGLGLRQFERRFQHEIGMPPKLYACIVRFETALRLKAMSRTSTWTRIAQDLGYHDQMHMVHDFRRLSGDSPARIHEHLDMFVGPEVCIARASAARAEPFHHPNTWRSPRTSAPPRSRPNLGSTPAATPAVPAP